MIFEEDKEVILPYYKYEGYFCKYRDGGAKINKQG